MQSELERLTAWLAKRTDRQELLQKLSTVIGEKIKDQDGAIQLRDQGRDVDAMDHVKSNRGKSFMDEANLYLTAITLESNEQLKQVLLSRYRIRPGYGGPR